VASSLASQDLYCCKRSKLPRHARRNGKWSARYDVGLVGETLEDHERGEAQGLLWREFPESELCFFWF
jgi:hypothetical protein